MGVYRYPSSNSRNLYLDQGNKLGWTRRGPEQDSRQWSLKWRSVYIKRYSNIDTQEFTGQGTWFISTHCPDIVFAAAPISGYSSIQGIVIYYSYGRDAHSRLAYVPYHLWRESDPRLGAVLQSSLLSYRHELLVANLASIPILQQHGSADDNVPTYHSRRMSLLLSQSNWTSDYVELRNKGHWFEGVMTTHALQRFYNISLRNAGNVAGIQPRFTFVMPSTGEMGSRAGIVVDQLLSPDQLGKIEVNINQTSSEWTLKTSNILRFHFSAKEWDGLQPKHVLIDSTWSIFVKYNVSKVSQWFIRERNSSWIVSI